MKVCLVIAMLLIRSAIAVAQNFCECGADFLHNFRPEIKNVFSNEALMKEKVKEVNVYAGTEIKGDSILLNRPEYRIYRFKFDNGKMIARTHFKFKDMGSRRAIGIPSEWYIFKYFGDTLYSEYFSYAMYNYEERYSFMLSDKGMSEYLDNENNLKYATISDFNLDKNGNILKMKRRSEEGEIMADDQTQTIFFQYDKKDRPVEINSIMNLSEYGIDSTSYNKSIVRYNDKKKTSATFVIEGGKEREIARSVMDKNGKTTLAESLNDEGKVESKTEYTYNDLGLMLTSTTTYLTEDKTDCGVISTSSYEIHYLPSGLPHYITNTTNKGVCSYVFKYGY